MKRYFEFVARHPYLLAALCVVLFLPWLWLAALVPPWAILTSLALMPIAAFVGLALIAREVGGDEDLGPSDLSEEGLAKWRKAIFGFLSRNARPATAFFSIPANRVIELGIQIEL